MITRTVGHQRLSSVGVVHDGLDVVPGEEAGGRVHHSFKPAVLVLLDDVDDRSLLERQLVLLVGHVVVDGHHFLLVVSGGPRWVFLSVRVAVFHYC